MRITAIRGRGLASLYDPFEILLDRGPLAQSGLYSISGQTGAGKSTILDAMCLGLFGETPRLRGRGKSKIGRLDPGQDDLRLSDRDPRALLSRGCGEGFAEVEFVGVDKEKYRARWSVRRSRKSSTGRLQKAGLDLFRVADDRCLSDHTTSKTLSAISHKLGLSFDQFCRSVLLAQGDFAAFLRADDKERADLLERMTGTQVYKELSIACHLRNRDEQKEVGSAQHAVAALEVWDEEQTQRKQEALVQQRTALGAAKAKLEGLSAQKALFERREELKVQLEHATQVLAKDREAWQQAAKEREELAALVAVESLRPLFDQEKALQEKREKVRLALETTEQSLGQQQELVEKSTGVLKEHQVKLSRARDAFAALKGPLAQARALDLRLSQLEPSVQRADSELQEARIRLQEMAEKEKRQEESLAAIAQKRARLSQAWPEFEASVELFGRKDELLGVLDDLFALQIEHKAKEAEIQKAKGQEQSLMDALEKVKAQAKSIKEEQDRLGEQGRPSPEQASVFPALQPWTRRMQKAGGIAQTLAQDSRRLQQIVEGLDTQKELKSKLEKELSQVQEDQTRERARLEGLELRLQEAVAIRDEASAMELMREHRSKLQEGKPCPLCGSTQHPILHNEAPLPATEIDAASKRMQMLGQEIKDSQGRGVDHEKKVVMLQTRLEPIPGQMEQAQSELSALRERRQELGAQYEACLQGWEAALCPAAEPTFVALRTLDPGKEGDVKDLVQGDQRRLQLVGEAVSALDAEVLRLDKARLAAEQARKQEEELRRTRDTLLEKERSLSASLTQQSTRRAKASSEDEALVDRSKALKARLTGLWSAAPGPWRNKPESLQALATQVRTWLENVAQAMQSSKTLEQEDAAGKEQLQEIQKQTAIEQTRHADLQKSLLAQRTQLDGLKASRGELLSGEGVEQVEARHNAQLAAHEQASAEQASALESQRHRWTELKTTRESLTQQRAALVEEHQKASAAFEEKRQSFGQSSQELREKLSVPASRVAQLRTKIDGLDQALAASQTLHESRRKDLEKDQAKTPQLPEMEKLRVELEHATHCAEEGQKAVTQTELEIKQNEEKRSKQRELLLAHQEQIARAKRWGQLNDLIGHSEGYRFQRYAQGLSLDRLLLLANRHLQDIDRRYRLARVQGDSLDLQVVDTMMGDEIRSIHSLSGGESFLVSLALALGLSSLSAMHTRVESLFIDEGFGTLDRESLEQVLAALDALQATGRQVGLISHVEGMAEQLGAQVRVLSCGHGKSQIRVQGRQDA